jgi:hypothetical protein
MITKRTRRARTGKKWNWITGKRDEHGRQGKREGKQITVFPEIFIFL